MSLTLATAATLPQQRTIFSLVAWSGATPLTVTVCEAPSYLTSRPSALRPCEAMYFSIAWPAVAFSALMSGVAAGAADGAAGAAFGWLNSFSPASWMKLMRLMVAFERGGRSADDFEAFGHLAHQLALAGGDADAEVVQVHRRGAAFR